MTREAPVRSDVRPELKARPNAGTSSLIRRSSFLLRHSLAVLARRWPSVMALTLGLVLLAATGAIYFAQELLATDSGPVTGDVLVVLGGGWTERPKRAAELF